MAIAQALAYMNTNGTGGSRLLGLALAAALLAPGILRAEVGVVTQAGSTQLAVVYLLNGMSEDPSPINPVWRKFGTMIDMNRVTLNATGDANGDGDPSLVSDAVSGLVVAAWSRNSPSGFDVVVSRFVDGAWTAPAVVAGSPANELDPQLALGPDGSVHLFYWVAGPTPQVFHVVAPANLSSWSAAVLVSPPGEAARRPAVAFYDGVLHVAYQLDNFGNGNTPRQVVLARLDNGTFIPEVVAVTENLGDVEPQVHSHSGHLWVDWVDAQTTGGSGEIAWTRLTAAGQWEVIRYAPFANIGERNFITRGGTRMQAIQQ